ncbi:hypothetical protein C6988_00900 [Nitrosopumilus sp. b1]|uniref:Gfo/Idh/MocA family protein n=1 Tax=Nitrosopumilus sp. b1 TaxID=2109907 RepID=UPI0015F42B79|nr:Gfo/Idh/MocA family oxidoreductase [Nitrosopumilus sp. b1]KAF6243999.1 hypothetical protein C6988_00900 [Nitrosopumilus sp. b1]
MKKINCAVIGCGRIGCGFDDNQNKKILTHAGSYFFNKKTNLVALCDIDTKKLKKYGKKYQINGLYTESSKMFESEKIDCISICTLADSHLDLVKEAINYNVKGIFVEKPISTNLKDAQTIIDLCQQNQVKLAVDFQRRFDPFYHGIKKYISQNKLGLIQLVQVYYGGGIANTGTHLFDLLRYLFGEIKSVRANYSVNKSANTNDPNIDVTLDFFDSMICQIHSLDYRNYVLFEMDILGSNGRLKINLVENKYIFESVKKGENVAGYNTLHKNYLNFSISKKSSIFLAIDDVINCLGKKKIPMCTGVDGYRSLELVIACHLSSQKKNKVLLPIKNLEYNISSK